ncbi:MAG: putative glycoside hydrolase [Chloroherpetonaceae bacterium]|nr:putative glycoside hydrolase family 15 protein [Chthonomonadaceae bacterium]MDW8206669.1 putative glycoside hydrolase [Chloroherpetonaceae bacterium]
MALAVLILPGQNVPQKVTGNGQPAQIIETQPNPPPNIVILQRIRPDAPVRLGGVFTRGLGDHEDPFENSAQNRTLLSPGKQQWLIDTCDVVALSASTLSTNTFREIVTRSPLFTPLLYVYASTLYEQDDVRGNVGGWNPKMASLTLRDRKGQEVKHPETGGHWMDFASTAWARHWRDQVLQLVTRYGAQGVVAAELPIGNTFVADGLQKYRNLRDRGEATVAWLRAARAEGRFLMVPSTQGFDALVGRSTLPVPPASQQPELMGRYWDEFFPYIDGGWAEGWVCPYWLGRPLPEKLWEIHLEAADRAARNGQVFIACYAYRNAQELEYGLASYLLVAHKQGRFVFQPMPRTYRNRPDAGFSLAVLQKEYRNYRNYFDVPLGPAMQERHLIPAEGGFVWRRAFYRGAVYVNSSETRTITLRLGGTMRRVNGQQVRTIRLTPQSGVILLHDTAPAQGKSVPSGQQDQPEHSTDQQAQTDQ